MISIPLSICTNKCRICNGPTCKDKNQHENCTLGLEGEPNTTSYPPSLAGSHMSFMRHQDPHLANFIRTRVKWKETNK